MSATADQRPQHPTADPPAHRPHTGGPPPAAATTTSPAAAVTARPLAGPPAEPPGGDVPAADPLAAAFKDAMASLCSPVTVVTAMHDGAPRGVTVSAFASLSLVPPMVTIALDRRSSILPALEDTGRLGVCVLGAADHELALTFASGSDRFARAAWHMDHGLPRLAGVPGWIECEVARVVDGGDHVIVLGRVVAVDIRPAATLAYQNRRFGVHTPLPTRRRPGREPGREPGHALETSRPHTLVTPS